MAEQLKNHLESILFVADQALTLKEIKECLDAVFETEVKEQAIAEAIESLKNSYHSESRAFELCEISNGYQLMTKASYHPTIAVYLKQKTEKRLSRAALETLAIIAYKQPVTKSEVEAIRGVNCDYSIQKLLEKELVSIVARAEGPGRPLLYGTSPRFMDYFGIKSLDDLPQPKEFADPDNQIGEQAPIEETKLEVKDTNGEEE